MIMVNRIILVHFRQFITMMAIQSGRTICKICASIRTNLQPSNYIRPHDGWLDIAKPYIAAYHAGATSVDPYITSDELIYWYRPTLRSLDCDATDTTMVSANNASGNYFEGR